MDIEANRLPRRRLNKGWELLGKYKRYFLAILFLELEVISLVLDLLGKSELVFVLAAFLLSALGFGMTVYICINERTIALTRSQSERKLGVVEIAFSVVQLVATFTHFVLASAGVKENYSTVSLFPVVFSIVVVIFIFRKDGVDDSSEPAPSNRLVTVDDSSDSASSNLLVTVDDDSSSDWRHQLKPDTRERIVNKITDTLIRHIHPSSQVGLHQLKRIAVMFEEKVYSKASSQTDYLRRISLKMLTAESRNRDVSAGSAPYTEEVAAETNPMIKVEHDVWEPQ